MPLRCTFFWCDGRLSLMASSYTSASPKIGVAHRQYGMRYTFRYPAVGSLPGEWCRFLGTSLAFQRKCQLQPMTAPADQAVTSAAQRACHACSALWPRGASGGGGVDPLAGGYAHADGADRTQGARAWRAPLGGAGEAGGRREGGGRGWAGGAPGAVLGACAGGAVEGGRRPRRVRAPRHATRRAGAAPSPTRWVGGCLHAGADRPRACGLPCRPRVPRGWPPLWIAPPRAVPPPPPYLLGSLPRGCSAGPPGIGLLLAAAPIEYVSHHDHP